MWVSIRSLARGRTAVGSGESDSEVDGCRRGQMVGRAAKVLRRASRWAVSSTRMVEGEGLGDLVGFWDSLAEQSV